MKILDILINEYTSMEEVVEIVDEVDMLNPKQMIVVFPDRKTAVNELMDSLKMKRRLRPMYVKSFPEEGYFLLYDLVVD